MTEGYPEGFEEFEQVYGQGGVRIYRITPEQAKKIMKQFPEAFRYKLSFASTDLFYMNVNHGEQHQVFSVDGKDR